MRQMARDIPDINLDKIIPMISFSSITGCWNWSGFKDKKGYGQIGVHGTSFKAHRVLYKIFNGSIDRSLVIDHMCRNTSCVSPIHLRQVDHKINITENSIAISALNKAKTHCNNGHEFTKENTAIRKDGNRLCRECRILNGRRLARERTLKRFEAGLPSKIDMMKTHCKYGHEFTNENTYIFKSGKRGCKICSSRRRLEYRNKKINILAGGDLF